MKLLEVERNPLGWRVRVYGRRIHHGLVGIGLVLLGVFLMARDIEDWPWLRDW